MGFRRLRTEFWAQTEKIGQIFVCNPHFALQEWKGAQPSWHFGFNDNHNHSDGPRWAFSTLVFTLIVWDMPPFKSGRSLVEVLHEIDPISTLAPNCLASGWAWISLMVLPEGILHMCSPTKSGPWGVNAVGEEHVPNAHKCVLLGKEFRT